MISAERRHATLLMKTVDMVGALMDPAATTRIGTPPAMTTAAATDTIALVNLGMIILPRLHVELTVMLALAERIDTPPVVAHGFAK